MAKKVIRSKKRKIKKNIERGQAHIQSSFNNTIVTVSYTHLHRSPSRKRLQRFIQQVF